MPEQLTKREQIAAMLAAAMSGGWMSASNEDFSANFKSANDMIGYVNRIAIRQVDDLLRRLEETEARSNDQ